MRFAFIAAEKACYPVALMCRVLKVSRSGYYAWCQRPAAAHTLKDQSLALEVARSTRRAAAAMAVRGFMRNYASAGGVLHASV